MTENPSRRSAKNSIRRMRSRRKSSSAFSEELESPPGIDTANINIGENAKFHMIENDGMFECMERGPIRDILHASFSKQSTCISHMRIEHGINLG
jgi:serine/threonine protein phosphatase PrpC